MVLNLLYNGNALCHKPQFIEATPKTTCVLQYSACTYMTIKSCASIYFFFSNSEGEEQCLKESASI